MFFVFSLSASFYPVPSSMVARNLCRGLTCFGRKPRKTVCRGQKFICVDPTRNWSVKPDKGGKKIERLQTQSAFLNVGPSGKSVSHGPQHGWQAPLCWATRHCCVAAGLPLDDGAKRPSDELASNCSRERNAASGFPSWLRLMHGGGSRGNLCRRS